MNNEKNMEIATLPHFARLIQPLTEKELSRLWETIASSQVLPFIHTWNGYHLTDQDLYQLCINHNNDFAVSEMSFEDENKAALYICISQLSRDNLSPEYRKYLIGQRFRYSFLTSEDAKQPDSKYSIAVSIGHDLYMSAGTVMKYYTFATAVDSIFDHNEELAKQILLGKTKVSHENILELSRLMPEELKKLAHTVAKDKVNHITLSFIRNEVKWSHIQESAPVSRRIQREQKLSKQASIRQMPEYNPDAEVNSLCMTIDSWISSIQRVHNSEKFAKISSKASLQLIKKLTLIEHTINVIQESLVERKDQSDDGRI